jgi:hypothetical protein
MALRLPPNEGKVLRVLLTHITHITEEKVQSQM